MGIETSNPTAFNGTFNRLWYSIYIQTSIDPNGHLRISPQLYINGAAVIKNQAGEDQWINSPFANDHKVESIPDIELYAADHPTTGIQMAFIWQGLKGLVEREPTMAPLRDAILTALSTPALAPLKDVIDGGLDAAVSQINKDLKLVGE